MNTMTIVVISIFIIFIILGFTRGLVKSVLKLVITGVALLLAYYLAPVLSDVVIEKTVVDDYITEKVKVGVENIIDGENIDMPTRNEQIDFINELQIPDYLKEALIENNNDEFMAEIGTVDFYTYISRYLSLAITNALAFALIFTMAVILLNIIAIALQIVAKLPIVGSVNKVGGAIFGLLEALVVVWIMFVFIALLTTNDVVISLYDQINESPFLKMLYDNNILMNLVTDMDKLVSQKQN